MIELTERQRKEYLERHLANALFYKLSRGPWHTITQSETSLFKVLGAGQSPRNPAGGSPVIYMWLATVSTAIPRFGLKPHAILLDSVVYNEALDQFEWHTQENWGKLLESGIRQLYYFEGNRLRRNRDVHYLMHAIAEVLIKRLEEMKLIIPIERLDHLDMQESHEKQMILAALRYPDP
ncbi:MAG: hypothetical protein AVDCRST_MAG86-1955 [uncultured Truepera sp.]|uniref:Uncharacterized protein n=1 Tax=uncultured Truepera sp. TaxID=543023 RepID=A0A6J4VHH7_9DEIN|nr:MAG: hypothetical protein AVDCRST_MAG86-1955 [uncultured Truepera sp.]